MKYFLGGVVVGGFLMWKYLLFKLDAYIMSYEIRKSKRKIYQILKNEIKKRPKEFLKHEDFMIKFNKTFKEEIEKDKRA